MRQLPLVIPVGRESVATFDNFQPAHNEAVLAHLKSLATPGSGQGVPVFLWGPPGSGKTHLLRALAFEHQALGGKVGWFDALEPVPWPDDASRSLLVFDNCDRYDDAQQQAAFALFIEATQRKVPVAAAAQAPPVDLPLRDDLRTRLGWGPVFAVRPLSEAEARAALRREADRRGILLSDEVMHHLLTRFERDLKSLVSLIERLDAYALAEKRGVTVPLLRQMLAEPPP